jgi:hypothetical protein
MSKTTGGTSSTGRTGPRGSVEEIEVRIRLRAYTLYLARWGGAGTELDDWLQAEGEIRADVPYRGDRAGPGGRARPTS